MKKVFLYVNKEKDLNGLWKNEFCEILHSKNISYSFLGRYDLDKKASADCLFILGGDGTILSFVDFSVKNNIPIIAINAGRIGFLTEFEKAESSIAVDYFLNNQLIVDKRTLIVATINGKEYISLNDIVVERLYGKDQNCSMTQLEICFDNSVVNNMVGNGVIVCSSTGSTAYSLSAGGAVLDPKIDAFSLTPVCAHSLSTRPVIFSSDTNCSIKYVGGSCAGLFTDGKLVLELKKDDIIFIKKYENKVCFLRRKDWNFYKKLAEKLKG